LYSDWEPGQPDDSTSVVVRQSHIRYRTLGTSWLGAKWGNASLSVDGFIVEFDDDPPSQQPASDPYGVIFMQQSPPGSSVALVVHREGGKAFHARRELNMSHTLFVAPGRYEWESLTFSEEGVLRQTKKGEVTIRAAQRVVFSAEGPSDKRPETSSSGTMTGAALRVWHGSLARRRKTVDLLTDVCRRAS
jgi:hypothetical protein